MFENKKPLYFIKPTKEGKLSVDRGKDETGARLIDYYDSVTAKIKSIAPYESEYNGETIRSWRVRLFDTEHDAILTTGQSSGFTRGLFNSLCNADLNKEISISCYVKNDFLQPSVRQNGEIIKWKYQEFPKAKSVMVGNKEVKDDTPVIEWLGKLVEEINSKLSSKSTTDQVLETFGSDIPNDLPF